MEFSSSQDSETQIQDEMINSCSRIVENSLRRYDTVVVGNRIMIGSSVNNQETSDLDYIFFEQLKKHDELYPKNGKANEGYKLAAFLYQMQLICVNFSSEFMQTLIIRIKGVERAAANYEAYSRAIKNFKASTAFKGKLEASIAHVARLKSQGNNSAFFEENRLIKRLVWGLALSHTREDNFYIRQMKRDEDHFFNNLVLPYMLTYGMECLQAGEEPPEEVINIMGRLKKPTEKKGFGALGKRKPEKQIDEVAQELVNEIFEPTGIPAPVLQPPAALKSILKKSKRVKFVEEEKKDEEVRKPITRRLASFEEKDEGMVIPSIDINALVKRLEEEEELRMTSSEPTLPIDEPSSEASLSSCQADDEYVLPVAKPALLPVPVPVLPAASFYSTPNPDFSLDWMHGSCEKIREEVLYRFSAEEFNVPHSNSDPIEYDYEDEMGETDRAKHLKFCKDVKVPYTTFYVDDICQGLHKVIASRVDPADKDVLVVKPCMTSWTFVDASEMPHSFEKLTKKTDGSNIRFVVMPFCTGETGRLGHWYTITYDKLSPNKVFVGDSLNQQVVNIKTVSKKMAVRAMLPLVNSIFKTDLKNFEYQFLMFSEQEDQISCGVVCVNYIESLLLLSREIKTLDDLPFLPVAVPALSIHRERQYKLVSAPQYALARYNAPWGQIAEE